LHKTPLIASVKSKIGYYNNNLKAYARDLRRDSTKAEIRLWCELLRSKTMHGYSFRRQRPVLNYIADFICLELSLIIEVDGLSHHDEDKFKADLRRTNDLNKAGFTVLRFDDEEKMDRIDNVQRTIEGWIDAYEERQRS
jgi:very-short-patch-repair endonuclease